MINFPYEDYPQQHYGQHESFTIKLEPVIDSRRIESLASQ